MSSESTALLASIAFDLRLPLLQIKSRLESLQGRPATSTDLASLQDSSSSGLRLLEAYLLYTSLQRQTQLPLEPIAIGALLDEAAATVGRYASHYDTQVIVERRGAATPVLAHRRSALLALCCLTESIIRAQAGQGPPQSRYRLVIGAHRYGGQLVAGVYGAMHTVTTSMLKTARVLAGSAQQPFATLSASSGSGILVAESLCQAWGAPLKPSRHNGLPGLATHFGVSNQLQLL